MEHRNVHIHIHLEEAMATGRIEAAISRLEEISSGLGEKLAKKEAMKLEILGLKAQIAMLTADADSVDEVVGRLEARIEELLSQLSPSEREEIEEEAEDLEPEEGDHDFEDLEDEDLGDEEDEELEDEEL